MSSDQFEQPGSPRSSAAMFQGALGGGDSPLPTETLEASDLEPQLRQRIALLTGGRDRRGGAVLTFPCPPEGASASSLNKDELKYLLTYLVHAPSQDTQELGFTILVDMRLSTASWSNTKLILQVLQRYFRGLVEAVYIVQPTKFLQKHSTAVSLRREAKDVDFEVTNVSSATKLERFVELSQLTAEFGGFLPYNHENWIDMRKRLERFLNNSYEIISRLDGLFDLMSQSRVADDLSAAETMLRRHQAQHDDVSEVPASTLTQGERMLQSLQSATHNRHADGAVVVTQDTLLSMSHVRTQLEAVRSKQRSLESLWSERQAKLQQCAQLLRLSGMSTDIQGNIAQLGNRHLYGTRSIGDCATATEGLRDQHEAFAKQAVGVRSDYEELRRRAGQLLSTSHYATPSINAILDDLAAKVGTFISRVGQRGMLLIEAISFHRRIEDVMASLTKIEDYCDDEIALPTDVDEANKRLEELDELCQAVATNVDTMKEKFAEVLKAVEVISAPSAIDSVTADYSETLEEARLMMQRVETRQRDSDETSSRYRLTLEQCQQVFSRENNVTKILHWLQEVYVTLLTHQDNIGAGAAAVLQMQEEHHEFSAKAEKSHNVAEQLIATSTSLRQQLGLPVVEVQMLGQLLATQWKLTWAGLQEKAMADL